jgi:hypothetical protein
VTKSRNRLEDAALTARQVILTLGVVFAESLLSGRYAKPGLHLLHLTPAASPVDVGRLHNASSLDIGNKRGRTTYAVDHHMLVCKKMELASAAKRGLVGTSTTGPLIHLDDATQLHYTSE